MQNHAAPSDDVITAEHALPVFIGVDGQRILGRATKCDVCLPHPSVSPIHAVLERRGSTICVRDRDSQFGTFKNSERKQFAILSPGDRVRFGLSATYAVESGGLRLAGESAGMSLRAHCVELAKDGKRLVEGLNFTIAPSTFVGILGPSGAGKSTLLQMLAGYLPPAAGWLEADADQNVYADEAFHQRGIGFVAQDDIVFPTLTIRENLIYAAKLRFGATERAGEIDAIVDEALHRLELDAVADNVRYSGGQRKRLSVAIELLKQPRLLLLDEPTSGLDPAADHNLIEQLKKLTSKGTTVVCTTHQLADLAMFDELIVLGVKTQDAGATQRIGCLAYQGPPSALLRQFQSKTVIQAFEALSYGSFEPPPKPGELEIKPPPPPPIREDALGASAGDLSLRGLQQTSFRAVQNAQASLAQMARDVSLWMQMRLMLERQMLIGSRDRYFLASLVAQPVALGALMALSQFRSSAEVYVEFFMIILALWMGMNSSVRDLVRDRKTFVRERLAGMSPQAFYLSRLAFHFAIGFGQSVLLLAAVGLVGRLVFSDDTWQGLAILWRVQWLLLILVVVHFAGVALGLLVSAIANSEESAIAAVPLLIMPQLLLSAVATGQLGSFFHTPRSFAPILNYFSHSRNSWSESLVDFLSLFCVSRPALLLADANQGWITIGDFLHLWLLIAATLAAAYIVFLKRERTWPKLIGLG